MALDPRNGGRTSLASTIETQTTGSKTVTSSAKLEALQPKVAGKS